MNRTYTQADRQELLDREDSIAFRKTARIIAVQMTEAFTVRTDRGPMIGAAGDWLVTNHPDDDPGSDMWTISDERMKSTYQPVGQAVSDAPDAPVLTTHPLPDDGTIPGIGSGSGEL